jgi:hypothetical protein
MYTVSKHSKEVILTCRDCSHIEYVNQFNTNLGSQRTQAARAMHEHSRNKHHAGPLLPLLPRKYGVMSQW